MTEISAIIWKSKHSDVYHSCCKFGSGLTYFKALIRDIEGIATVLTTNLPDIFVKPFSKAMMPPLMSRVRELWLDRAIPSSLEEMEQYKSSLALVHGLADKIDALHWPGTETLYDWCKNAPRIWLNKRKESELDRTRNRVSNKYVFIKLVIADIMARYHSQARRAKNPNLSYFTLQLSTLLPHP